MFTFPLILTLATSPNVVIINADDLGYGDLGCYGATNWRTPNLDRLAKDGIRFTDFYTAQPVCSASRAALLTGCYPNRVGISGALGPNAKIGLHDRERTIAHIAKAKGYSTAAIGKWHLGHRPEFLPTRRGFDQYLGLPYSNDMWPSHPEAKTGTYPTLPLIDGETAINPDVRPADQAKLTGQYTKRAVEFITANKAKPFFLYLAHSMPHVPIFAGDDFRGKSKAGTYGDVIQEIDHSVGTILDTLKQHDLERNTLVIFTSDNGPWLSYGNHAGTAGPLREGKGTVWDGGVRVPCVAKWPGVIPAGAVGREPMMTIDLLPTITNWIGGELPKEKIDGLDCRSLFDGTKDAKSPHPYFAFYYQDNQLQAIRSGPWKLMLPHTYRTMIGQPAGKDGTPGKYRQVKLESAELYNLSTDVGEMINVAGKHPDVMNRLMAYVDELRSDLGDSLTKSPGPGRRSAGLVK